MQGMSAASALPMPAVDRKLDPVVKAMLVVPSLVTTPAIIAGAIAAAATGDGAAAAWVIAVSGLALSVAGTWWAARHWESGRGALISVCGVLCAVGVVFATASAAVFDPVHLAWLVAAVTIPSAVMAAGWIVDRTALVVLGLVVVNVVWAVDLALLGLAGLRALIVQG
jgi:hypothetical protein